MRYLLGALLLVGCAHEEELRPAREPSTESTFSTTPPQTYSYSAEQPPPQGRPRLSQTITLGQEDYVPLPSAPQSNGNGNGVNVTVNNNINVAPSPPVYYGGYYGGGYYGGGGYGRRGGDGRANVGAAPAWRGSGWEGAQRTAAPGQTPAVGGNWSPPPSYGPKQMK